MLCPSDESIFAPDIRRDTLWNCPNCHVIVTVPEVGLCACPNCGFYPPRWHAVVEDGPDGG